MKGGLALAFFCVILLISSIEYLVRIYDRLPDPTSTDLPIYRSPPPRPATALRHLNLNPDSRIFGNSFPLFSPLVIRVKYQNTGNEIWDWEILYKDYMDRTIFRSLIITTLNGVLSERMAALFICDSTRMKRKDKIESVEFFRIEYSKLTQRDQKKYPCL